MAQSEGQRPRGGGARGGAGALAGGASLSARAVAILSTPDAAAKAAATRAAAAEWRAGGLAAEPADAVSPPNRPARPDRPELLAPGRMPRRRLSGEKGRMALLHAIAHIELNAIDLAWDMIARFAGDVAALDPSVLDAFVNDWVSVADDEARHFGLLADRLSDFGAAYGDLPAHDGLWDAARKTDGDILARLAIAPMVLEARGLDVTPDMVNKLTHFGDSDSAAALQIIYDDEIGHVAIGSKWFGWVCAKKKLAPERTFHDMVNRYFTGGLKPPFNANARQKAGLLPSFYLPLAR